MWLKLVISLMRWLQLLLQLQLLHQLLQQMLINHRTETTDAEVGAAAAVAAAGAALTAAAAVVRQKQKGASPDAPWARQSQRLAETAEAGGCTAGLSSS